MCTLIYGSSKSKIVHFYQFFRKRKSELKSAQFLKFCSKSIRIEFWHKINEISKFRSKSLGKLTLRYIKDQPVLKGRSDLELDQKFGGPHKNGFSAQVINTKDISNKNYYIS